jgi:1-acyl-sn-glycerol-3-phosphate acyltransferase
MKALIKLFGFLWALWGCFWFMAIIIPFTILYAILFLFTGKKYVRECIWINCHYLCSLLLHLCFIRVRIHGKEKINPAKTYVFVSNHLAQVDILVTGASVPHPVSFLAKSEIRMIPFFGYMTKMLAIMVDRKNAESRAKSLRYMIQELQKGYSIFIYPEGTRNRTGQPLKEFKDGAFKTAISAQVPIAIQTQVGTKEVNNPQGLQLYPGTVDVYWSEPIETKGMTLEDMPALIENVKAEMLKHLS